MSRQVAILLMAAWLLAATGCGRAPDTPAPTPADPGDGQVRMEQADDGTVNQYGEDLATRLEAIAKSIPEVQDAHCVVIGNTAIVGITVDPKLERSRVNTIKYSVAEALRKDPQGIHAFVTADMGLGERIREVAEDIRNGKPFSGFAQELGDIIGRIIPQLPRDVEPMDREQDNPDQVQQRQPVNGQ